MNNFPSLSVILHPSKPLEQNHRLQWSDIPIVLHNTLLLHKRDWPVKFISHLSIVLGQVQTLGQAGLARLESIWRGDRELCHEVIVIRETGSVTRFTRHREITQTNHWYWWLYFRPRENEHWSDIIFDLWQSRRVWSSIVPFTLYS